MQTFSKQVAQKSVLIIITFLGALNILRNMRIILEKKKKTLTNPSSSFEYKYANIHFYRLNDPI